ncbi:MAG: TolC family protein [Bacteroidales bacterium]|nr:TolC family protein [Bacteroidales bacterium]
MKRKSLLLIVFLTAFTYTASAQMYIQLTLNEYLERVRKGNLEYAAERLSIEFADAEIISASVFNEPSIGLSYYNNELKSMQMGQGGIVEISKTISPGRRSAAIQLARGEKELTTALLTDYFRRLREEATYTWLETVKLRELFEIRRNSYKDQIKIMESDSIRRAHINIRDLDALQNKVETGILFSEIIDLERELYSMYQSITNFCGIGGSDTVYIPERKNIWNNKEFNLNQILESAVENRADIIAALKEIDVSKYAIKAAKKEKIPEFDIFMGYGFNSEVKNELAPAPRHNGIEFGISIPIPLSNRGKGEILSATARRSQAEIRYSQSVMQVKSEVVNAYNSFLSADKKLKLFTGGLVRIAKEVLDEKREEYYNGDIHLIEVMDAQRSYDEILLSFYSTIYEKSQALVRLESAIGVWNIE